MQETPISDDGSPLQVINERISFNLQNTLIVPQIYSLHEHGSAHPEASGEPVFSRILTNGKPTLIKISLAGQTITHKTTLGTFVSSNYLKIISSSTLKKLFLLSEKKYLRFDFVCYYE